MILRRSRGPSKVQYLFAVLIGVGAGFYVWNPTFIAYFAKRVRKQDEDEDGQLRGGVMLKGWRYGVFVSSLFLAVGLASYPVIIAPMRNPEQWKQISQEARRSANIKQEDIQPGNMKVWTDPFDRPGKPGNK